MTALEMETESFLAETTAKRTAIRSGSVAKASSVSGNNRYKQYMTVGIAIAVMLGLYSYFNSGVNTIKEEGLAVSHTVTEKPPVSSGSSSNDIGEEQPLDLPSTPSSLGEEKEDGVQPVEDPFGDEGVEEGEEEGEETSEFPEIKEKDGLKPEDPFGDEGVEEGEDEEDDSESGSGDDQSGSGDGQSGSGDDQSGSGDDDDDEDDAAKFQTDDLIEEDDDEDFDSDGILRYSKYATVVPDPFHVPIDETTATRVADSWGKWHFWDGQENERPVGDYVAEYPNRDMPGEKFDDYAWQADAVFVNHLIDDAEELVARAMEAIYTEYGHGKPLDAAGLADRRKMFRWDIVDFSDPNASEPEKYKKRGSKGGGGWTTDRSFNGLVRRLLHAIMTNDTFTVVMGGHSAAAGHGNHFHQSYMMQFHRVMAPIFARMGVKLITRNIAQGGLGTIQNAMGAGSFYGDEVDLLLWDSGMTETNPAHIDLFLRQGLLGGNRVPVVWGGHFSELKNLHENADVDVGQFGNGMDGIPTIENEEQLATIPHPAKYLKCAKEVKDICKGNDKKYCAVCWIKRSDLNPTELFHKIKDTPGSQVSWHPGWRSHQLQGRVLAMSVLEALQSALQIFSDGTQGGPPLDDEEWHVTEYYENIRTKLKNMDPSLGSCHTIKDQLPERMCNTKMQGRSFFTPRANPALTSISSIIRPEANGFVPKNTAKVMYDGPDAHNTCFDSVTGEVDVITVVSGRRLEDVTVVEQPEEESLPESESTPEAVPSNSSQSDDDIVPGLGWEVIDEKPGNCDGTYNAICGRTKDDECPAIAHHDSRGQIVGNELSGWLVMDLPDLKEGIIVLKVQTWVDPKANTVTQSWTTVNNKRYLRQAVGASTTSSGETTRRLGLGKLPDSYRIDFAINGKITTYTRDELIALKQDVQRVVETLTLLDDPNFTSEPATVELAIRMRGCGKDCLLSLTHVYWA